MSAKRQELVLSAFALFYEKGVHAVGINEVLAVSGVAKKTLYNHFASKDELVLAVLDYRNGAYLNWLGKRLDRFETGAGKIDELFEALDDWFNDREQELHAFRGCFFINVSGEYGDPDSAIYQRCADHKAAVEAMISASVELLRLSREDSLELTEALSVLKDGAISKARVQGDLSAAKHAKKAAHRLITSFQSTSV
ncbi:TetR/AcrR family transcriptional regulator [Pseudovibrio sp. JE062]|uniref:TetR/AcrR family transcriptional regulator n=1 Tax=Pseudovibrio sp. JE062 TaxID=439495 RepID=UPI000186BC6A|nr:TetR/AcrR family transcriptional regulator [Pseudovibrio sp. JE062]EEA95716.1 transcriptional regulator, TetR family [Pseudovibrio sp. JE062]